MKADYYWENWTDQEILDLRLCDLHLSIEGSWVSPLLKQVRRELRRKGLSFQPHFWISDEWFCPDGIPGVALPFYLFHPRLMELEKRFIYEVEGGTKHWCLKLIRHEVGHSLDNAYGLRQNLHRKAVFGVAKGYPKSYSPRPYSRNYVAHLDSGYAQSHPDEDFAETFAVWLTPQSHWRRRYEGTGALQKLRCMDSLMSMIRHRPPRLKNRMRADDISKQRMTLRDHYFERRKELGLETPKSWDRDLKSIFAYSPSQPEASKFIAQIRPTIRKAVAEGLGEYQYHVDSLILKMQRRAGELQLGLNRPKKQTEREFLDLLTGHTLDYISSGKHRINM